ncbi:hypothetical protein LUZ60_017317 [Juncus effusus]|nr:hypothetical protein LUZ60_017317 [Juncus effusus]
MRIDFPMDRSNWKIRLANLHIKPIITLIILVLFTATLSPFPTWFQPKISTYKPSNSNKSIRKDKYLEIPQIIWGLNNQKIALARGLLTARFLNRTLLMPSLSASLFYKEVELLQPMPFEKIFNFEKFNSICDGFVRIGKYSELLNKSDPFELQKGSGRKWTKERDLDQLKSLKNDSKLHNLELIKIVGKNPFLWQDHWPVKDYARIFECLILIDEIERDVVKVISKIKEIGFNAQQNIARNSSNNYDYAPHVPYIAVHMRIEKDWMIHCKKWEQRSGMKQICSSKDQILDRLSHIMGLNNVNINKPIVIYLAIADSLLEDDSILNGWKPGLLPYEKKRLKVWEIYKKHPYLIQSAIDFEVCLRADVFFGNSFSTFSNLVVLSRTQKMLKLGFGNLCGVKGFEFRVSNYAYNILGGGNGAPKEWISDMNGVSLENLSYGSENISCDANKLNS